MRMKRYTRQRQDPRLALTGALVLGLLRGPVHAQQVQNDPNGGENIPSSVEVQTPLTQPTTRDFTQCNVKL